MSYYVHVLKNVRNQISFFYTDKDLDMIKEEISIIEMKPEYKRSPADNHLLFCFKNINIIDQYIMDGNYTNILRYLYDNSQNIQIYYDVDPNIKNVRPINMDKIDEFIDEYKTIIDSKTLDTKLYEINALYQNFKKLFFCVLQSKPFYYISTITDKTLDSIGNPTLLKTINMFSQNNVIRDDSTFIKHGSNPKLQYLEIIRYYKQCMNNIKELLSANGIELINDSMDELNYTEQFIEAVIERIYARI